MTVLDHAPPIGATAERELALRVLAQPFSSDTARLFRSAVERLVAQCAERDRVTAEHTALTCVSDVAPNAAIDRALELLERDWQRLDARIAGRAS